MSFPKQPEWNLNSDPPTEDDHAIGTKNSNSNNELSSILRTPTKAMPKSRMNDYDNSTSKINHSGGVVDNILNDRYLRSNRRDNLLSSSPLSPVSSSTNWKDRKLYKQTKLKEDRNKERENKMYQNRGGLEKMEDFVMKSERSREIKDMGLQATDNSIPDHLIDYLEEEHREDLEDRELIQIIEYKEHYEQELEQLLSELSFS